MLAEYSFYLFASVVISSVFRYGLEMSANVAYFVLIFSFISIAFSGRIYCFLYDLLVEKRVVYGANDEYGYLYRVTEELSNHLSIKMPLIVLSDKVEICAIEGDKSKSILFINPDGIEKFNIAEMIGIISHELAHIKLDHAKFSSILCIPFIYTYYFLDFSMFILECLVTPVLNIVPVVNFLWSIVRFVYVYTIDTLKSLINLLWKIASSLYYKLIEPQADKLTIELGTDDYLISALEKMETGVEEAGLIRLLNTHKAPRDRITILKNVEHKKGLQMKKFNPFVSLQDYIDFNAFDCALGQRVIKPQPFQQVQENLSQVFHKLALQN